jgi:nucleoside-diphosphate-sugar epimerase
MAKFPGETKRCSTQSDRDHVLAHTADLWSELRGASIFITGGTGFVGTWLLQSLTWADDRFQLGVKATVITRSPEAFARKAPHLAAHRAIELVEADACCFRFPEGQFPFVIHAATERHFAAVPEHPLSTYDIDVKATRRVLEFARTHGTRRLLFTSSGAMYGRQPAGMTHIPEDYVGAPGTMELGSAYGHAKRMSEWMCAMYAAQDGYAALIARLFAFVGPHLPLDANFAVGNFIRDALQGGPIRIAGDGTPYRSYLYAADLAVWLWTILVKGESCRPYNVGSGEEITIADLARAVAENTRPGMKVEIAQRPVEGAAAARYVPSVAMAENELGLRPVIGLAEGIRRTYEWGMRARNGALSESMSA